MMAIGFSVVFVALSLWLLPRLKGLFVGLQWAKRMHGFGGGERRCRQRLSAGPAGPRRRHRHPGAPRPGRRRRC